MDKGSGQDTTSKDLTLTTIQDSNKTSTSSHIPAFSKDYTPVRKSEPKPETLKKDIPTSRQLSKVFTSSEIRTTTVNPETDLKSDTVQKEIASTSISSKIGKPSSVRSNKKLSEKSISDTSEKAVKHTASVSASLAPVTPKISSKSLKEVVQSKAVQKVNSEVSMIDDRSGKFDSYAEESKELESRQEDTSNMDSSIRNHENESQSQTLIESQLLEGDGESSHDLEIKSLQSQPESVKSAHSASPQLIQEQKQTAEMAEKVTLSAVLEFHDETFEALKNKQEAPLETPSFEPRVKFQTELIDDFSQPKRKLDKTPLQIQTKKLNKLGGLDEGMAKYFLKPLLDKLHRENSDEISTKANRAIPEINTPKSNPPIQPMKSEPKHDYFERSGYDMNVPHGLSGKNTPHQLIEGLRVESPNKSMMETPYANSSHWEHNLSESIQRQNNLFTAQITAMHNELDSMQLVNNELVMKLNNFERDQMIIGKNILNTEMEIKQLKSDNRTLEIELKRHEHNIKLTELEYKEHHNGIENTNRKVDEYKLKIYKLNEDRSTFREEKNGLELKLVTKQEEVSRLEQDLDCKKRDSEQERHNNSNLTQDLSRKKKQLEEQRKKLNAELERTKSDYEDQLHKQERDFTDKLNNQKYHQKEKLMNLKYKGIDLDNQLSIKSMQEEKLRERSGKLEVRAKQIKDLKYKINSHKEQNEDNTFNLRALENARKFSFLQLGFYMMLGLIICSFLSIYIIELK